MFIFHFVDFEVERFNQLLAKEFSEDISDSPEYKYFAILIIDESFKTPIYSAKYMNSTNWKNNVRKMLKSGSELYFVDPATKNEVKVYLDSNDLKSASHKLQFDDAEEFFHFLYIANPEGVTGVEDLKIEDETFKVIRLWTLSKFVLRNVDIVQFAPIIPAASTAQTVPVVPSTSGTLFISHEISDIGTTGPVYEEFKQYLEVAKYTDLNDPVFLELSKSIFNLTREVYAKKIVPDSPKISSFASIIGPSLMGKTQFAFSLASSFPVFYVNFAKKGSIQLVYEAFDSISSLFKNCLLSDLGILASKNIELESDCILDLGLDIELNTIGLLCEFVEYSVNFTGNTPSRRDDSNRNWFQYYLKSRTIKFEKMSLKIFLRNLGKSKIIKSFFYSSFFRYSHKRLECRWQGVHPTNRFY